MNYRPTNFLPPLGADRGGDAIRGMHSRCMVIRSEDSKADGARRKQRGESTGEGEIRRDEETKYDVRKREEGEEE